MTIGSGIAIASIWLAVAIIAIVDFLKASRKDKGFVTFWTVIFAVIATLIAAMAATK